MTQVPTERAALASWRVWGSNITILMLSFVVAPQIKRFTGDPAGLQQALFITTAIFVVVGMVLYLYTVATVKEQVQRDVPAPSLKESFGTLLKNKPLIWLCLGSLAFLTGVTAIGTLAAYYALYVLNDAQFIAWNAVAQAAGTFLSPPSSRRSCEASGNGMATSGSGSWALPQASCSPSDHPHRWSP